MYPQTIRILIALGAAGCSSTVEEGAADSAKPRWESRETHLRAEPSPDWLRLRPARETTGDVANPLNTSADGQPERR